MLNKHRNNRNYVQSCSKPHETIKNDEPISAQIEIVRTTDELDRLKIIEKYEKDNNVKIL